jgi:DNA-directed RNA polymerase subunit M/transcription elongation factor TFIIS
MSRDIGIQTLSIIVKNKQNAQLVEKYIYEFSDTTEEYLNLLYETVYFIKNSKEKLSETIKTVISNIYEQKISWKHPRYDHYKQQIEEEDQFMTTPFEIEEGVLECKCGSKKTISFQRQTRSADEGSTTFAQCVECGSKWRHNN